MSDSYEEDIRKWWNGLPLSMQDQLHKAAVDNYMDDKIAASIINSNPAVGPTYTEWVSNSDGSWGWSETMRRVILEEAGNK